MDGDHGGFEQTRPRGRPSRRNATDIGTTYVHWMHDRRPTNLRGFDVERPALSYTAAMLPPAARKGKAVDTIPARQLHSSFNKVRHPVNVVKWTPDGRRLLTGSTSGEFTLWNGTGFNFETIMQAHDSAVRAVEYAHSDEWLISSDQEGNVKYWQPNFNNVQEITAHPGEAVRDLSFAPNDSKFVTASDDQMLKIFDFASGKEESVLHAQGGHGWDVKSVDWHPSKGLIVSGSKDHLIKLWDPRSGRCITTLHGYKSTVNMTRFEPTRGVLLASCSRDQNMRVFDIQMMRDVFLLRGHEKEVNSIVWHRFHSNLLTTGSANGEMFHYLLDEQNAPSANAVTVSPYDSPNPADSPAQTIYPAHKIQYAHEYNIWSMDWHPMGHILASGSNDRATRFWTRPRPGDHSYVNDKWHIGQEAAEQKGTWKKSEQARREEEEDEAEDEADGLEEQKMPAARPGSFLPGLPGLAAAPAVQPPPALPIPDLSFMQLPNNPQNFPTQLPFPPPPHFDLSSLPQPPPGMPPLPPGFVPPPGFPMLPGMTTTTPPSSSGGAGAGANSVRKRGPLPSQQDSLKAEMQQGRYLKPR
ncbi:Polyadenylation factor subunit 2 [Lecanosticta acicola]|uniref:Polyadenylation factor subunit 2 n=1 Tax=Lecanosticta acicola TaxID=111012 RepID=A0AAI8YY64_9PEZI|nr:Polyadenylation factor subunit 2 [Lecanosticta acicola]